VRSCTGCFDLGRVEVALVNEIAPVIEPDAETTQLPFDMEFDLLRTGIFGDGGKSIERAGILGGRRFRLQDGRNRIVRQQALDRLANTDIMRDLSRSVRLNA
tara:strand:- start:39861 stop:40166 length:306 start_codon:yes stop_codon:yes gene_type:complete